MSRGLNASLRAGFSFPRTRGDEPESLREDIADLLFSPHTRG